MISSTPERCVHIGQTASLTKVISDQDVQMYAQVTGDFNPIHLDEAYAVQTRFGRRIAHGMLTAGLISSVLANQLPGPGTIYLSQTLKFRAPVYLGDSVTVNVTVTQVREDKPIATLSTECRNQQGELVLDGEAVVLFA